jgi:hypothetical protein
MLRNLSTLAAHLNIVEVMAAHQPHFAYCGGGGGGWFMALIGRDNFL